MNRFPKIKVQDYCFNPLTLVKHGEKMQVSCGACLGCKLHKANDWALRCEEEVSSHLFTLFVTYTYSNKYLPVMVSDEDNFEFRPYKFNLRYAGNGIYKFRDDDFSVQIPKDFDYNKLPITNYDYSPFNGSQVIPYSSKRDFQLYLKLLRKDIYEKFSSTGENYQLRYFAVSEYGETLFRPHVHALFFVDSYEVAQYLAFEGLYKSWQMCDKDRFQRYVRFARKQVAGYLTQYFNSFINLPGIYRAQEIRPFRLSSKNPAIGFYRYEKAQVLEDVAVGSIEYVREVKSLTSKSVYRYSKSFMSTLFPKNYRFGVLPDVRRKRIYGLLFNLVRRCGFRYMELLPGLYADLHPLDWQATRKCYYVCETLGCTPDHYMFLLDNYYYKNDMFVLKRWYTWQENADVSFLHILNTYINWSDYVTFYKTHPCSRSMSEILKCLGICYSDFLALNFSSLVFHDDNSDYIREVSSIMQESVKMPKFNEKFGFSPNSPGNIEY